MTILVLICFVFLGNPQENILTPEMIAVIIILKCEQCVLTIQ